MTKQHPLKFAVVREDYTAELELCRGARRVLVVASGGCTALSLKALLPDLEVHAFDNNKAQLTHVRKKAGKTATLAQMNVEDDRPTGVNQCGAFETSFRVLRTIMRELVSDDATIERFFDAATPQAERGTILRAWTESPYWRAAFTTVFNDGLLVAMFGTPAIQHAHPGSYPGYFANVFQRGLMRPDAHKNPYLQHVFLGCYKKDDAPPYIRHSGPLAVELIHGSIADIPKLDRFDVISISNILDWSNIEETKLWARVLADKTRRGAAVLTRQLNNQRDLRAFFEPYFAYDDALGAELTARDRSLFYERIEVARRV